MPDLDAMRAEFIVAQGTIAATVGDGAVVFGPELDSARVLQLASDVLSAWPDDTPYDLALLRLAATTAALLLNPSPATVDAWHKARAEHADGM